MNQFQMMTHTGPPQPGRPNYFFDQNISPTPAGTTTTAATIIPTPEMLAQSNMPLHSHSAAQFAQAAAAAQVAAAGRTVLPAPLTQLGPMYYLPQMNSLGVQQHQHQHQLQHQHQQQHHQQHHQTQHTHPHHYSIYQPQQQMHMPQNHFHQLAQYNQLNQLNQLNQVNQINQFNQLNQLNQYGHAVAAQAQQINQVRPGNHYNMYGQQVQQQQQQQQVQQQIQQHHQQQPFRLQTTGMEQLSFPHVMVDRLLINTAAPSPIPTSNPSSGMLEQHSPLHLQQQQQQQQQHQHQQQPQQQQQQQQQQSQPQPQQLQQQPSPATQKDHQLLYTQSSPLDDSLYTYVPPTPTSEIDPEVVRKWATSLNEMMASRLPGSQVVLQPRSPGDLFYELHCSYYGKLVAIGLFGSRDRCEAEYAATVAENITISLLDSKPVQVLGLYYFVGDGQSLAFGMCPSSVEKFGNFHVVIPAGSASLPRTFEKVFRKNMQVKGVHVQIG